MPNQLKGSNAIPITAKSTIPLETTPFIPVESSNFLAKSTILGRKVAARIIINKISGNAASISPTLVINESTLPLKYPAIRPRLTPSIRLPVIRPTSVIITVV